MWSPKRSSDQHRSTNDFLPPTATREKEIVSYLSAGAALPQRPFSVTKKSLTRRASSFITSCVHSLSPCLRIFRLADAKSRKKTSAKTLRSEPNLATLANTTTILEMCWHKSTSPTHLLSFFNCSQKLIHVDLRITQTCANEKRPAAIV